MKPSQRISPFGAALAGVGLALAAPFLSTGCQSDPSSAPEGPPAEGNDEGTSLEVLPTPFTADEIRRSCRSGTQLVYSLEGEGQPDMRQAMVFREADAEGVVVETWYESPDGQPLGERSRDRQEWAALRDHALFPAGTTRERVTVTVPQGTHEGWHYRQVEQSGGATTVNELWFSDRFPGPPVRMTSVVDGVEVMRMELLARAMP